MFNITQSVSEPTHNLGQLLDILFSKQSDNTLFSTKLHHGLTSDHTTILCKLMYLYPYKNPRLSRTDASKRLIPVPLNKTCLTLSHKPVCERTEMVIVVNKRTEMVIVVNE